MLTVSVYRYNPETDQEPYMQDYQVDTKGKDVMVLDVLEMLKAQDSSLVYRRSCREGVCGSDGMNIAGKTVWPVLHHSLRWLKTTSWSSVRCPVCRLSATWSST